MITEKRCSSHRGVIIYREKIEIPNLKEQADGTLKELKPSFDTYYKFTNGYREDSVKDCKESIDRIWEQACNFAEMIDPKDFTKIMNEV